MSKKKSASRHHRRHQPKPQGMSYADVLTQKKQAREAVDKAARDVTVKLESDTHTQRAMWLMVVSIHDAFGIGPERMRRDFFPALQENSDWVQKNTDEVDVEYAYEKLRKRAEECTGIKIEYLYEHEAAAAALKHAKDAVKSEADGT